MILPDATPDASGSDATPTAATKSNSVKRDRAERRAGRAERARKAATRAAEVAETELNGATGSSTTPEDSGAPACDPRYPRLSPDEFVEHAKRLLDTGWHPLPLGDGEDDKKGKALLVSGVTGHDGVDVTSAATLRKWAEKYATRPGGLNLGTRMPLGVLGIDVDCYDAKPGAETVSKAEAVWGPLPATWSLTARTDGSRKLFYRVPDGWTGPGILEGGGVELLQRHHRYAVTPPSIHHSGNIVRAFDPEGRECGDLPSPSELPELPVSWLEGLRRDVEALAKATVAEGHQLWDRFKEGAMTHEVVEQVNKALDAIGDGASRYDTCRDAIYALVALGAERQSGVAPALRHIGHEYAAALGPVRGATTARDEFDRMVQGALRKVAANHPAASMTEDDWAMADAAFANGGRWNPETPGTRAYKLAAKSRRVALPSQPDGRQYTQSLAGITPRKVDWLWWPWIPRGKLTIFEGEPDVGKSTMTLKLAAMVSNGGPWPRVVVGDDESRNEKGLTGPASVVLVGVEDDLADTVVPRLNAAGANLARVSTMARPRDENGRPVPFLIPDDVDRLRHAIEEADAKLVVIDPISAFMSDAVKPGSDTANRKALMTLADVAEQTDAAIVLVRHLNKGTGMSAKHRGGGSIAYTALARSVLLAAKLDPGDDRESTDATHALASTKGNLARAPRTMGYQLSSSPTDPDSPIVRWAGLLDESADQLVGADGAKPDSRSAAPVRDEAEAMIRELLAEGPLDAADVRKVVAREVGCGEKTVSRAADRAGVIKTPVRDGTKITHWRWSLSGRVAPGTDRDSAETDRERTGED
ncbi:AAA family ATPase [Gordonia sp. DT218]|uniref:AAA family ATPase n=1 Tax=Gordonia sp. DT218 TaxID=3416659 RepID=UPI003CF87E1F